MKSFKEYITEKIKIYPVVVKDIPLGTTIDGYTFDTKRQKYVGKRIEVYQSLVKGKDWYVFAKEWDPQKLYPTVSFLFHKSWLDFDQQKEFELEED